MVYIFSGMSNRHNMGYFSNYLKYCIKANLVLQLFGLGRDRPFLISTGDLRSEHCHRHFLSHMFSFLRYGVFRFGIIPINNVRQLGSPSNVCCRFRSVLVPVTVSLYPIMSNR